MSKIQRGEIENHLLLSFFEVFFLLTYLASTWGLTIVDLIMVEVATLVEEYATISSDIDCLQIVRETMYEKLNNPNKLNWLEFN